MGGSHINDRSRSGKSYITRGQGMRRITHNQKVRGEMGHKKLDVKE
jgi:hypothetical protein